MRPLPSEVLRACPECHSRVTANDGVSKTWSDGDDDDYFGAELIGITCNYCATELHLWWFVNDFEPAMDTIEFDYEVLDFEDGDLYDDDDESIAAWESRMLCCSDYRSECTCSVQVSWNAGVRACLEQFDLLEDFYEYSDNMEAYNNQEPSCMNCINFGEASCVPLRNRMYDYTISASTTDPIHVCQDYMYDIGAYNHPPVVKFSGSRKK